VAAVEVGRAAVLACLGLLVLTDTGALPALVVAAFLIGAGETVMISAVHAVVPQLVPPENLASSNGSLFAIQMATENLLGPAIGGILFAAAASLPFLLDGVSFAAAAVLFAFALVGTSRPRTTRQASTFGTDVVQGLRYYLRSPVLRNLGALVGALAFCQAMVFGPLVLFALDGLGLSDAGYGALLGVAAIGNVIGGTVAGRLDQQFGARILMPASAVLAAAAYAVCGTATTVALAAVALAIEAIAVAVGNVASLTLRQRIIPSELLGRVGNVMRFFIFGAMPLGALAGGFLVERFGVRAPFAGAAVLQLVAVAIVAPSLVRALDVPARTTVV